MIIGHYVPILGLVRVTCLFYCLRSGYGTSRLMGSTQIKTIKVFVRIRNLSLAINLEILAREVLALLFCKYLIRAL